MEPMLERGSVLNIFLQPLLNHPAAAKAFLFLGAATS